MSGKNSRLNSPLRKLLAKIQREFEYPKVVNVKCRISADILTYEDEASVNLRTYPQPDVQVQTAKPQFDIPIRDAALGTVVCHRVQPLSELNTLLHDVDCWSDGGPLVHHPELPPVNLKAHKMSLHVPSPQVKIYLCRTPPLRLKTINYKVKAKTRGTIQQAAAFPMRLRMTPMSEVSKKLLIRYRTSVFKLLNVKPNQVKFVGVVHGLPKAPLRLADVQLDAVGGAAVSARIVGPVNTLLGRRLWVLIQLPERGAHYLPITLKEELA